MSKESYLKGSEGESLAVKYLVELGYRIIKTNFKSQKGEIDIIAIDENVLVFIEVKYYGKMSYFHPLQAINNKKIKNIINSAKKYYYTNNIRKKCRYDVLAIENNDGRKTYTLIKDAFREYKDIR